MVALGGGMGKSVCGVWCTWGEYGYLGESSESQVGVGYVVDGAQHRQLVRGESVMGSWS